MRSLATWLSYSGLAITVLLWLIALVIALFRGGSGSYTCGFPYGSSWLVNIVVHPDGRTLLQYFPENFSRFNWPYCRRAREGSAERLPPGKFLPQTFSGRGFSSLYLHLGFPLLVFGVSSGLLCLVPLLRRRRRRRLGLCEFCAYDLGGSPGGPCPECGHNVVGRRVSRKSGSGET